MYIIIKPFDFQILQRSPEHFCIFLERLCKLFISYFVLSIAVPKAGH